MSFGFSVGDFVSLGKLAWNLYKECKAASAQFQEIQNEVISLRTAIQELQDEAENNDSILNRAGIGRKKELDVIMRNCAEVLRELQQLLTRYKSLGTKQKRTWDRIKFGSEDVQEIRDKLMFHTSALTLFLTSLGTGSLGRIEKKLDDLAADIRAGHHEPSLITSCDEDNPLDDQDNAWRLLIRELSEDFTREEIEVHKLEIKSYIRRLIRRGDLEEKAPSSDLIDLSDHEDSSDDLTEHSSTQKTGKSTLEDSSSSHTRWPPHPYVESDHGTTSPSLTEQFNKDLNISKPADDDANARQSSDDRGTYVSDDSSQAELPSPKKRPINSIDDLFPAFSTIEASSRKPALVGIDMNFDYCRVAAHNCEAVVPNNFISDELVFPNEHGNHSTPTYVAFTPDDILIGEDAKNQASRNAENTFFGFTLLLGAVYKETITRSLQENSCFQINNHNGTPAFFAPCRQRHYSPEELTAFVIKKMVRAAEIGLRQPVSQVSISVPSYMTKLRMEAVCKAVALAKFDIKRVRFSTAAAIYKDTFHRYQETENDDTRNVLVINARVDGYDCSLFGISEGVVEPLGTIGELNLSLDAHLRELLHSNFVANHPNVTTISPSPREWTRLARAVEEARQQLMSAKEADILLESYHDGLDLKAKIHSEQVLQVIYESFMPGLRSCFRRLLLQRNVQIYTKIWRIAEFVLVGELTRLPAVREQLESLAGLVSRFVKKSDPVECAVLGVALELGTWCENCCDTCKDMLLMDGGNSELHVITHVTESSVGEMTHIFGFGTIHPNLKVLDLYTLRSDQGGILLRFYDKDEAEHSRLLFEIAVSLPNESHLSPHDRLSLQISSGLNLELDFLLKTEAASTILLKLHRSPSGLLGVKHGLCLPISPHIRETWLVTTKKPKKRLETVPTPTPQATVVPNQKRNSRHSRRQPK